MKPAIVKLSNPHVAAALSDLELLQRWEVLRRSDVALTAHQLAQACGDSLAFSQGVLDRLVDAGFADRIKASKLSKRITYRSVAKDLVIVWDASSDAEMKLVRFVRESCKQYGRGLVDRAQALSATQGDKYNWMLGDLTATLTRAESTRALEIVIEALRGLRALELGAYKRRRSEGAKAEETDVRHYYAVVQVQQLDAPQLPLPNYTLWEKHTVDQLVSDIETSPDAVLSRREHEVAKLLAAGDSRPKIAQATGLTTNTIASLTKRIYRKLDVHSRAELAARIRAN